MSLISISLHAESGKGSDLSSVILLSSPQHFSVQSARSFDLDDTEPRLVLGPGLGPELGQELGPGLGPAPGQGPRPGLGHGSRIPRKVSVG